MDNIRFRDSERRDGGSFYCDPSNDKRTVYLQLELADMRALEPDSGWYAESCGTVADWHRIDW